MTLLYTGKPDPGVLEYLMRRRSAKNLTDPGPDGDQLRMILTAASRVPDHGKMFPWYFIVFQGEARKQAGELVKKAWLTLEPDATPAKLDLEAGRFTRAPVVIGVISRIREGKNPAWEQILSAGAVCMNLSLAANACGYATVWLTEWYSYDPVFRQGLGLGLNENIAGFIHIGTPAAQQDERERPDLSRIVTEWTEGAPLNKGDGYGHSGKGLPQAGFFLQDMDG